MKDINHLDGMVIVADSVLHDPWDAVWSNASCSLVLNPGLKRCAGCPIRAAHVGSLSIMSKRYSSILAACSSIFQEVCSQGVHAKFWL